MKRHQEFTKLVQDGDHAIAIKIATYLLNLTYHPPIGYHPEFYHFGPEYRYDVQNDADFLKWIYSAKGCEDIITAIVKKGYMFQITYNGVVWMTVFYKPDSGNKDPINDFSMLHKKGYEHDTDYVKTVIMAALSLILREEEEKETSGKD